MLRSSINVFVYGTLRSGLGNYSRILDGNTIWEEPATLTGATMYDGGGCPFVTLTGDRRTVVGEVMTLHHIDADITMRRLDRLESFFGDGHPNNMYDRVQVEVTTERGETVTAYTYVASAGFRSWLRDMPVVESGDWKMRRPSDHIFVTA